MDTVELTKKEYDVVVSVVKRIREIQDRINVRRKKEDSFQLGVLGRAAVIIENGLKKIEFAYQPREMTVAEISKKLGYEVKVVKE